MAQKVDPNNVELKKGFVFNETGNIMMSTTDFSNPVIEQSVRNVFQEVAVFFAGMTKALESTAVSGSSALIDTESGMNYSLYDYAAMKRIVDSSGCFVQVNEEDVDFHSDSFGMDFSKELVEVVLGLATGTGELAFAKAMVGSLGQAGLKISADTSRSDKRVANIVFVCEYLLGMPVISAIVLTADSQTNKEAFQLGPCISESNVSTSLKVHKDTYLFVTPQFIKQYSPDIISGINDKEFAELVAIFEGYLK